MNRRASFWIHSFEVVVAEEKPHQLHIDMRLISNISCISCNFST